MPSLYNAPIACLDRAPRQTDRARKGPEGTLEAMTANPSRDQDCYNHQNKTLVSSYQVCYDPS